MLRRFFHLLVALLCVVSLGSCTCLSLAFKNLGETNVIYKPVEPYTFYRAGDKVYMAATVHEDKWYGPAWMKSDLSSGPYRIVSTEPRPCFVEVQNKGRVNPGPAEVWDVVESRQTHTFTLPEGATPIRLNPDSCSASPSESTVFAALTPHALYAYPLAAVSFVAVDVPLAVVFWSGSMLVGVPAIFISKAFDQKAPASSPPAQEAQH